MKPRERVLMAINHLEPDRLPVDYIGTPEVTEALFRHFRLDDISDETEKMNRLLEALGVDLRHIGPKYIGPEIKVNPDGSYVDMWGAHRRSVKTAYGAYDEFVDFPLRDAKTLEEIEAYPWPSPDWFDYTLIKDFCERFSDFAIVAGGMGGCDFINGTSFLRSMEQVLLDIGMENALIFRLFQIRSDFFYEYNRRILEAARGRIDIMFYGDDYGSQRGPTISPACYRKIFHPSWKRHIAQAKAAGAKVMLHCCGSSRGLIPDLLDTGFEILSTVQVYAEGMEPTRLKRDFGDRLSFHGGIDTQAVLCRTDAEGVRKEVRRIFRTLGENGGYILAPTHNIQPDTPLENVLAMYDEAAKCRYS